MPDALALAIASLAAATMATSAIFGHYRACLFLNKNKNEEKNSEEENEDTRHIMFAKNYLRVYTRMQKTSKSKVFARRVEKLFSLHLLAGAINQREQVACCRTSNTTLHLHYRHIHIFFIAAKIIPIVGMKYLFIIYTDEF